MPSYIHCCEAGGQPVAEKKKMEVHSHELTHSKKSAYAWNDNLLLFV